MDILRVKELFNDLLEDYHEMQLYLIEQYDIASTKAEEMKQKQNSRMARYKSTFEEAIQ